MVVYRMCLSGMARENPVRETISDERMYQAGLLQIVTKMRAEKKRSFEELFVEVRNKLRLHPAGFRAYVNANMNTVMATVKKTGTSRG